MDGLTSSTPAARTKARQAVTGATAFIGVAAVGGAGALVLGLGTSHAATTDDTSTTQVPQSFDQQSNGGGTQQSFGGPMATSGGS